MRYFSQEQFQVWVDMIDSRVWKTPKTNGKMPKPFKSGNKVNTVKAVTTHPQTGSPGFSFIEDDSIVECWRCHPAPSNFSETEGN